MKIEEPRAMYEIHKVREKIWREEKSLARQQRFEKHKKEFEKFIKKIN